MSRSRWAIWGSELSPFTLKLRACCDWAALPYVWLWRELREAWRQLEPKVRAQLAPLITDETINGSQAAA